ncbi:MAG: GNAT family N-acetyltransferase [Anaerolineae bacterium]|nr:GNAT family N-acetyltransferase [Anaerolineae bacterium]
MIDYRLSAPITNAALNDLFGAAWDGYQQRDFAAQLKHSLLYVCAYDGARLVGFVNLAWDGGVHAFLLDTTTHPDYQRQGIGAELVRVAVEAARPHGIEWVHVDYEPHLAAFYRRCGFQHTEAGLLNLREISGE